MYCILKFSVKRESHIRLKLETNFYLVIYLVQNYYRWARNKPPTPVLISVLSQLYFIYSHIAPRRSEKRDEVADKYFSQINNYL